MNVNVLISYSEKSERPTGGLWLVGFTLRKNDSTIYHGISFCIIIPFAKMSGKKQTTLIFMCYMAFGSNLATYSSILAWRIPWTEEPGDLQSIHLQRVGHNWATNSFTFAYVNPSLTIYPLFSPLITISLFSTSVAVFLFCK